jgi:hypothetical protein
VTTCETIAAVTQGEALDEVTANLRDAVALPREGMLVPVAGQVAHFRRSSWADEIYPCGG